MKLRMSIAAALAVTLLGAAACGSDKKPAAATDDTNGKGKTLNVWLMVDAESGWANVVDAATAQFKTETGADVKVAYQQWTNHLTKLDATLAGSEAPDVIELGNTEAAKYVFNGAFADIADKKSSFDNNANWLTGLSGACEADGKLYCVPYYAGARVLIYRTDLFETAGLQPPATYADFEKAAATLQQKNGSNPKFSAIYLPAKYWYSAMSWVYGEGGAIAKKEGGTWKGTLSEPAAQKGLQKWVDIAKTYSKGDPTKDESDQAAIFSQGQTGMMVGNTWEVSVAESQPSDPNDPKSAKVDTPVKGKVKAIPMPGPNGKGMPTFLGGSVLGVASKSQNKGLAAAWIKAFTSSAQQEQLLAKGVLPNATTLLDKAATVKGLEAASVAAKNSWFVPNDDKWADVEKGNLLQQMLVDVVTGKKTVAEATKTADEQIAKTLNG